MVNDQDMTQNMSIIFFTKYTTYKFNNVTTPNFEGDIATFDYVSESTNKNMKAKFYLPSLLGYSVSSSDNEL